jgi:hypothetical protein
MRLLLTNCILLLFFLGQTQAAEIGKGEYLGIARVQGQLELNTEDGQSLLKEGAVNLDLKSANLLFHPIKFFRGDRVLVVGTQNEKFSFKIPNELIFKDGKISVHQKTSGQSAHLNIIENLTTVRSYEEEGTTGCTHMGYCMTCAMGFDGKMDCSPKLSPLCPGSQNALFNITLFDRNLKIQIFNDSGRAEIQTSNNREAQKALIRTTSDCR